MSDKFTPSAQDLLSADLIQAFLRDRRRHMQETIAKSGVSPYPTQYLRNMARTLSNSASSPLALDADDTEPPVVDTSKMTAKFVITTSDRDRHGDIVIPRGCVNHLKNYTRNPRVFFAHNTNDLPIASARDPEGNLALDILDDKIYSTAYFHGETRESEIIFRLIARKELQASSIGFLPIRAAILSLDDEEDLVDLETGEEILDFRGNQTRSTPALRFLEWDMIEWSVVPIPANQEALAAHLSRGHVEGEKLSASIKRTLSAYLPVTKSTTVSLHVTSNDPEESAIEALETEIEKELDAESHAEDSGKPDPEELDEVYKKYKEETNMSYSALKKWSENPCAKRASLDSGPLKRNLELLSTAKSSWTKKHVKWANKTISFNSRMRGMPRGKPLSQECPWSKRDISLKNWAWDPGQTPKPKKDLDEEIIHALPAGPTPGVDLPLLDKGDAPAPPKDQITGSDTNKPGSASDDKGKIEISKETEKALKNKLEEHNEKMSGKPVWAKTTLGALKAVYRRGAGAFSTSHRPKMTRAQWALARVNAFLYLCKNGKPENEKYVSDNDLLHHDHPKYSKEKKSLDTPETRGVIPFHAYPLAPETTAWDGPKARVSADTETLQKICAWYDDSNADSKSAYKLPHHDAKTLKTVWNGVRAAMAALLGSRGGVDIPEKDKLGVYNHLAKHYKEFNKPTPEYRKLYTLEELKAIFPDLDLKELTAVSINEELELKSALDALQSPPSQGKPKKKTEDEEDEDKAAYSEEEEAKAEDEAEEEKASEENDEEAEKSMDDEEETKEGDEEEDADHHKILKSMSEILNSMHECSTAHTDLLKGIHDKLDKCMKSLEPKQDEEKAPEKEDEMKTLLSALTTLKSNQDALNRRLFEVTGKK